MKRAIVCLLFACSAGLLGAAPLVTETPIRSVGTAATVSISTSTLTQVPASSTLDGRTGFIVSNPATNNAVVVGMLGDCTSNAASSTLRPVELATGNGFTLFPGDNGVCLWLISLHTDAENIHVQEIKQ